MEQIERIVPWGEWITLIKLCYYKGERGNKPYDLELMLRIYLIQNLYDLADEATVAEVVEAARFRTFAEWNQVIKFPMAIRWGGFAIC